MTTSFVPPPKGYAPDENSNDIAALKIVVQALAFHYATTMGITQGRDKQEILDGLLFVAKAAGMPDADEKRKAAVFEAVFKILNGIVTDGKANA